MQFTDIFRFPERIQSATSSETVAAMRAVRRVAAALSEGEAVTGEDARTIDRVLAKPVSWSDLVRSGEAA